MQQALLRTILIANTVLLPWDREYSVLTIACALAKATAKYPLGFLKLCIFYTWPV